MEREAREGKRPGGTPKRAALGRHLADDVVDLGGHHDGLHLLARILGRLWLGEGQTIERAERPIERAALCQELLIGACIERERRADRHDKDLCD